MLSSQTIPLEIKILLPYTLESRQGFQLIVPYTFKYLIYYRIVNLVTTVGYLITWRSKRQVRPTDAYKSNLNMKNQGNVSPGKV
jgi:hypothetical protein